MATFRRWYSLFHATFNIIGTTSLVINTLMQVALACTTPCLAEVCWLIFCLDFSLGTCWSQSAVWQERRAVFHASSFCWLFWCRYVLVLSWILSNCGASTCQHCRTSPHICMLPLLDSLHSLHGREGFCQAFKIAPVSLCYIYDSHRHW